MVLAGLLFQVWNDDWGRGDDAALSHQSYAGLIPLPGCALSLRILLPQVERDKCLMPTGRPFASFLRRQGAILPVPGPSGAEGPLFKFKIEN